MPAGLLLGATDRAIRLGGRLADRFEDGRDQALIEHRIETMTAQRSFGIALGSTTMTSGVTTRCWRRSPARAP